MYILDVVPIARGISKERLSYFTATPVKTGQIIKVPLRKKTIAALVMATRTVVAAKTEIRSQEFQIRKIEKVKSETFLLPAFIESAHEAANYFATNTGSILNSLLPKAVIDTVDEIIRKTSTAKQPNGENVEGTVSDPALKTTRTSEPAGTYKVHEKCVIQAPDEERMAHYKSLIRESFARKQSVVFCLPTIHDIKKIIASLPKGIEEYGYVVHGSLPKKELIKTWEDIQTVEHPVLIIGTGMCLAIPRNDIGTIIIERETASSHKMQSRPYLDIRVFAEFLAKRLQAKLVFGDIILRTETLYRYKNHELTELIPVKFRSLTPATQSVIDMKNYKAEGAFDEKDTGEKVGKIAFRILSDELEEIISKLHETNENLFLYGARRGLSPMTVCADCSTIVSCSNCSAPVVLHSSPKGNFFLCHRCGERRSAEERCAHCNSWRLTPLGIGIERIEQEVKDRFPNVKIFRIDKDTVTTLKKGMSVINTFYNSPGSILLGTDLALLYLDKKIENAAVVSIDSLFSLPDFRINEKIMSLIVKIRAIAEKRFILQTRNIGQHIWNYATAGNLMDFYREELEEREKYEYPPFWTFIKITCTGEKSWVLAEMKQLEEHLKPYVLHVFPAFIERVKGKSIMHGIIKLMHKDWVDPLLLEKLTSLPAYFAIKVDPESLL